MMEKLLTRTEFREGVFLRNSHCCVICRAVGQDAHHILERRLFSDPAELGGYYLANGVTLCAQHHIKAEETVLTCEQVREAAGITHIILPSHLYDDVRYDKWGNQIEPNGTRLRGELFYDESVQKILSQGGVLGEFLPYTRYQRTYHLPWSNMTKDDRMLENTSQFEGQEVVVTVKMDGANVTMYPNYIHGRSVKPLSGQDSGMVKALHAQIRHDIPGGWRLCGENLYAKHSIHYQSLPSYFLLFSIWDERNECLSWDETVEWAEMLGLTTVPLIYRGVWDAAKVRALYQPQFEGSDMEGYVVRLARRFSYGEFRRSLGKFVRPNFAAGRHNYHRVLELNELAS
jgi:hypothetical protein